MGEYDYAGNSGKFPTPKAATNGTSTATFWDNSFKPLVDRTTFLYEQLLGIESGQLASEEEAPNDGAGKVGVGKITDANNQGVRASSTLRAMLVELWHTKGGLSRTNIWTALQTFAAGARGDDVTITNGARLKVNPRQLTRQQSMDGSSTSGNWQLLPTGYRTWINTAAGGTLVIALDRLPHGAVLDAVTVRWQGAAGHAALPGAMPVVTVRRIDSNDVATTIGGATDGSASVSAYELAHNIAVSGLNHTIDIAQYRYVISITGETGTNFVANAKAAQVNVQCTVTEYSEF